MRRPQVIVLILAAVGSATALGGIVFLALSWSANVPDAWGFRGFTTMFSISFGGTGALVAYRRPGNPVGWLLLVAGVFAGTQVLCEEYAIYGFFDRPAPLPGAAFAAWVESWIWYPMVIMVAVVLLALFPNGRYLSPRWRVLGWLAILNTIIAVSGLGLSAGPLNNAAFVDNPFPLFGDSLSVSFGGHPASGVFLFGFVSVVPLMLAAAISIALRYRRSAGAERQQLKWLVLAASGLAFALVLEWTSQIVAPDFKPFQILFIAAIAFIPIALGVAVLRYRLYDIDLLINRALVYGATSAAIGAVFFVGIVVLQTLLRPITGGSQIAVAVSTLLCFALFQPVQRRAQRGVDRRFYRAKYDASRTLDAFTERLGGLVELGAVRAGLLEAVGETFKPASASIWLVSVTLPGRRADRTES